MADSCNRDCIVAHSVSGTKSWNAILCRLLLEIHVVLCSADADVRLARRIRRDTLERGRDVNGVIEQVRMQDMLFNVGITHCSSASRIIFFSM